VANTLTEVIPKLLAGGLLALRERAIMPRRVNRDYESLAAQKGDIVNIPISTAVTSRSVTPAVTQAANQDTTPTTVAVTLDQWKEATFHMSDADWMEAQAGFMPRQSLEAIKSLANTIDDFILGKYTGIYGAGGTAGTTPLGTDLLQVASCRALLNTGLAEVDDRSVVLDVNAEAAAIGLGNFVQAEQAGDQSVVVRGEIGHKLGMDWFLDQNIPTHTNGTSWTGTKWKLAAGVSGTGGQSTLSVLNTDASGTIVIGDLFTIAGDAQQYVMTTAVAVVAASVQTNIAFTPSLAATYASAANLSVIAGHVVNLIFHRDAFTFASRPLVGSGIDGLGNRFSSATDPVSGISLRLEVSREYKQTTFAYDVLYGAALVRPQLATRLLG
jgi:hypothetical protein